MPRFNWPRRSEADEHLEESGCGCVGLACPAMSASGSAPSRKVLRRWQKPPAPCGKGFATSRGTEALPRSPSLPIRMQQHPSVGQRQRSARVCRSEVVSVVWNSIGGHPSSACAARPRTSATLASKATKRCHTWLQKSRRSPCLVVFEIQKHAASHAAVDDMKGISYGIKGVYAAEVAGIICLA